jgi:predicted SAM-dependent methyltransferase
MLNGENHMSETRASRKELEVWCKGNGIDLGCGRDKICSEAIGMDMTNPYTKVGDDSIQLKGDAKDLYWFNDGVLDYIYSSHLLEDFDNTEEVMKEWVRVIKPGGLLILNLPDEQTFRAHCKKTGQPGNASHKHEFFNKEFVKECATNLGNLEIIVHTYSFHIVFKKV